MEQAVVGVVVEAERLYLRTVWRLLRRTRREFRDVRTPYCNAMLRISNTGKASGQSILFFSLTKGIVGSASPWL